MKRPPIPAHVRLGYATLDVKGFGPGFARWYRRVVNTNSAIPADGLAELLGMKLEDLPGEFVPIASALTFANRPVTNKQKDKLQAMADARAQVSGAYATWLILHPDEA